MANILILTNFTEFNPGYSLSGIVRDQTNMLAKHGNIVYLYVSEKYHGGAFDCPNIILCQDIPDINLIDYQSVKELQARHKAYAANLADKLMNDITNLKIDVVFTHDWIFTGWNLPYALALKIIGEEKADIPFIHWVHSVPSNLKDWWLIYDYGPKHKIIYPNKSDLMRVAECFRGGYNSIRVIPHIKDIRSFFDFKPETCLIIDVVPALMNATFVQVYPASTDRLEAKRVDMVIKMFGFIKASGHSVCLFIANQWATGRQRKEDIEKYHKLAIQYGLVPGKDFIFSSELFDNAFDKGIPREIIRELMMLSNLFIYPTREESFGLCLPEVSLASGALCVLNRSLKMQIEVSMGATIYFEFGSYENIFEPEGGWDQYLNQVAMIVIGRFMQNESIMLKTMIRQRYNMDFLYRSFYLPVISEVAA
ncbi:MAG: hypothetical protein CSYNP_03549 [Syntrophus sp. SKADARSKE-3]|nr:hypothetical protein [Syntrophus sp. SKADARSKE-3]